MRVMVPARCYSASSYEGYGPRPVGGMLCFYEGFGPSPLLFCFQPVVFQNPHRNTTNVSMRVLNECVIYGSYAVFL